MIADSENRDDYLIVLLRVLFGNVALTYAQIRGLSGRMSRCTVVPADGPRLMHTQTSYQERYLGNGQMRYIIAHH